MTKLLLLLPILRRTLSAGNFASVLSLLMLLVRSRGERHTIFRGANAISHWLWGSRAFRQKDASLRYTVLGAGIHHLSSLFWATFFAAISPKRHITVKKIATRAIATTALAWVVDYHLTPQRFTPGFEKIISKKSRVWVYAAFATGLAAGALQYQRKQTSQLSKPQT